MRLEKNFDLPAGADKVSVTRSWVTSPLVEVCFTKSSTSMTSNDSRIPLEKLACVWGGVAGRSSGLMSWSLSEVREGVVVSAIEKEGQLLELAPLDLSLEVFGSVAIHNSAFVRARSTTATGSNTGMGRRFPSSNHSLFRFAPTAGMLEAWECTDDDEGLEYRL